MPGILGGLGPLSHIEFERKLIAQMQQRGACRDQDYPVWILMNGTDTPDRSRSLQKQAPNCALWLVKYAQVLQLAGADFLVVICNTSHAFYNQVQTQLDIPWIHIMESTTTFIQDHYSHIQKVGVLATDGTLRTQLYHQSLITAGFTPMLPHPDSALQQQLMAAIYQPEWGIKATGLDISQEAIEVLQRAVDWLMDQGVELIITGCTELSLGLSYLTDSSLQLPWIDPLDVMANLTLDLAFGERNLADFLA
jgi:aspartate racemase